MSGDDDDLFDSEVPAQTTEGVSPEAPSGPARDESGRFAARDQGESAAPEAAEGAPPAPAEKPSHSVPLPVFLEMRDELKALKAQFAAPRPEPVQMPDPVEDPASYAQAIVQQVQAQATVNLLKQSRFFAEKEYGKEAVEEAIAFFDDPKMHGKSAEFLSAPSPVHAAVEWVKEQKTAAERSSPDYEARLREKLRAELLAEMGQPSQPPARVPRSLAAAASAPGGQPPPAGHPLFS